MRKYILLTFVGVAGVVVSAYFLVESAVAAAETIGIPESLIGATIIAFGTSLPELSLDLRAFLKGHSAPAFGDIVGSSFVNITLILGITLFVPVLLGSPVTPDIRVFQNLVIFSLITNPILLVLPINGRAHLERRAIFLHLHIIPSHNTRRNPTATTNIEVPRQHETAPQTMQNRTTNNVETHHKAKVNRSFVVVNNLSMLKEELISY